MTGGFAGSSPTCPASQSGPCGPFATANKTSTPADRPTTIATLRVDERQRVVTESAVRAEIDGVLQFDDGLVVAAAQPERPAHRSVCGRCHVRPIASEFDGCGLEQRVGLAAVIAITA